MFLSCQLHMPRLVPIREHQPETGGVLMCPSLRCAVEPQVSGQTGAVFRLARHAIRPVRRVPGARLVAVPQLELFARGAPTPTTR